MVVAIFISLAARLLNSIDGHLLCYSAISSAGVVLILPGFLVCMCILLHLFFHPLLTLDISTGLS